jgi:hypothetical protein
VNDIEFDIIDQTVEADGYANDFNVEISFADFDSDGIPDNPDFFYELVNPNINTSSKWVFFQKVKDFDNLEKYLPVANGLVEIAYHSKSDIVNDMYEYSNGQVFYAYGEDKFYVLSVSSVGRRLVDTTEYKARVGRGGLQFQYRHNSPENRRINPGISNIIDLYLVTAEYYSAYQNYIKDSTGTVVIPAPPTIDQLTTAYSGLQDYKMISDNMILNSVAFKPLFGAKAAEQLRATIKVIKASGSTASVSEIKSIVVANIDQYFSIDKWDFGQTFYFSELAAYLHQQIGDIISSVVLVPLDPQKSFGDLYEIRSQPNQIFVNAAGVTDIEVIEALTSTNLRTAPGSGVI